MGISIMLNQIDLIYHNFDDCQIITLYIEPQLADDCQICIM